jgi:hypothetical protein
MSENLFDACKLFVDRMNSHNIQYMVVGSMGSIIYGEPRMTKDFDFVVELLTKDIKKFSELFPIEEFYCPPLEVINQEVISRGQFNLIHHASGLKIDIILRKNDEHSKMEFGRRVKMNFSGMDIYVAAPEDVIIKKLIFYRMGESQKHIDDIKGILANTETDEKYLQGWIEKLSLKKEWDLVGR